MSRAYVPKAFNPAGWDAVRAETIHKERKLSSTSRDNQSVVYQQHGGQHPPAGWAWFTKAGFNDSFDRERLVRGNFPQRPYWDGQRAAGHDTIDQKAVALRLGHARTGRGLYLDRTDSGLFAETLGGSLSSPASPSGAPAAALLGRSAPVSPVAGLMRLPAAGVAGARLSRSMSEVTMRPRYTPGQ